MFLILTGFVTKEPVVVNTSMIVRMTRMKEDNGSVIVLVDGNKALVAEELDDILQKIGRCWLIADVTAPGKEA